MPSYNTRTYMYNHTFSAMGRQLPKQNKFTMVTTSNITRMQKHTITKQIMTNSLYKKKPENNRATIIVIYIWHILERIMLH